MNSSSVLTASDLRLLANSENALAKMCSANRPSISARYELAAWDLSQNVPVSRSPVLLQNII